MLHCPMHGFGGDMWFSCLDVFGECTGVKDSIHILYLDTGIQLTRSRPWVVALAICII